MGRRPGGIRLGSDLGFANQVVKARGARLEKD